MSTRYGAIARRQRLLSALAVLLVAAGLYIVGVATGHGPSPHPRVELGPLQLTSASPSPPARDIYTVAGTGTGGESGVPGPALSARLYYPSGVAIDADGNIVIANLVSDVIYVVAVTSGDFYQQQMKAGYAYVIAGNYYQG